MKKATVFGCVVGVCSLGGAQAADLGARSVYKAPPPVAVATSWAGPYLGLQAGYLSGRRETSFPATGEFHFVDPEGFAGGLVGGFNWQWGRVVAGLEADISYVDARQTIDTGLANPSATQLQSKLDWNGHVRGRLGYAFDNALIFMAGGLAMAGVHDTAFDNLNGVSASWSGTRTGWSLGGGVDWRVARAVTVRLEYLYDNYGTTTLGAQTVGAVNFGERDAKLDAHTVRAGLNLHF
ncbi:MAG: porin family protein [Rhodopseudomonas palustris]|uniref:Porin family protein n=1 Tax=Rhodopseudomonas palustris TaxID=1076 RepID=A0A933W0Y9_RHOPL|nr:porin family protein [Rhodopseudomonas palustris]